MPLDHTEFGFLLQHLMLLKLNIKPHF